MQYLNWPKGVQADALASTNLQVVEMEAFHGLAGVCETSLADHVTGLCHARLIGECGGGVEGA